MNAVKRVVFPGTFDPFTVGHYSVVERALRLVDEIVIGVGVNRDKQCRFPVEKRVECIRHIYRDEARVRVMAYASLTVDFAQQADASFILRGVRSINDFEYEKNIADINRKLTGIDTLVLFTELEHSSISSGVVRELMSFGKDISGFVPKESQFI